MRRKGDHMHRFQNRLESCHSLYPRPDLENSWPTHLCGHVLRASKERQMERVAEKWGTLEPRCHRSKWVSRSQEKHIVSIHGFWGKLLFYAQPPILLPNNKCWWGIKVKAICWATMPDIWTSLLTRKGISPASPGVAVSQESFSCSRDFLSLSHPSLEQV